MTDLYSLASTPRPPRPNLRGTVVVRETADGLHDALGADLMLHAHNCVRTFGDFHLALSGGSTPMPFYQRLMIDPKFRDLPWPRTHLWVVDERRVPFEDDRSNYKHIHEIFGDHAGVPRSHVHPMPVMDPDPAGAYERALREALGWREKGQDRLDFVLLGMGSDGHTASLFPRSPALLEELRELAAPNGRKGAGTLVRVNAGANVTPPDRVTMTLRLINASRFVAVLVTGEGKRSMIERVQAGFAGNGDGPADVPVLGLEPVGGELRWYLDDAACPGRG